jgi:aminoglycoside phosphotransferase (APT) family kinase protein
MMRPPDLDPVTLRALVGHIFPTVPDTIERVADGVSTLVYRLERAGTTFYLRVLPEEGAGFGPEALAHRLLHAAGVRVPEVVHVEHLNEIAGRSVMVTSALAGRPVAQAQAGDGTRRVIFEAGQQLAILNSIAVDGFGWVRRNRPEPTRLEGEHPTFRTFIEEHFEENLSVLTAGLLSPEEVMAVRAVIAERQPWLHAGQGRLAHGDFDTTPIMQQDGRYTGIIDFGEIRGADMWYDLGHFRMHDGETLSVPLLDALLEGYRTATSLPDDHLERICFSSLLIATRTAARQVQRRPGSAYLQRCLGVIRREMNTLRGSGQ